MSGLSSPCGDVAQGAAPPAGFGQLQARGVGLRAGGLDVRTRPGRRPRPVARRRLSISALVFDEPRPARWFDQVHAEGAHHGQLGCAPRCRGCCRRGDEVERDESPTERRGPDLPTSRGALGGGPRSLGQVRCPREPTSMSRPRATRATGKPMRPSPHQAPSVASGQVRVPTVDWPTARPGEAKQLGLGDQVPGQTEGSAPQVSSAGPAAADDPVPHTRHLVVTRRPPRSMGGVAPSGGGPADEGRAAGRAANASPACAHASPRRLAAPPRISRQDVLCRRRGPAPRETAPPSSTDPVGVRRRDALVVVEDHASGRSSGTGHTSLKSEPTPPWTGVRRGRLVGGVGDQWRLVLGRDVLGAVGVDLDTGAHRRGDGDLLQVAALGAGRLEPQHLLERRW